MWPPPSSPRAIAKRIALRRPMPSSIGMLWIDTTPTAVETPQCARNSAIRSPTLYSLLISDLPGFPAKAGSRAPTRQHGARERRFHLPAEPQRLVRGIDPHVVPRHAPPNGNV